MPSLTDNPHLIDTLRDPDGLMIRDLFDSMAKRKTVTLTVGKRRYECWVVEMINTGQMKLCAKSVKPKARK